MAKSLKSKSKRQFRKIKREDPKSAYNLVHTARLARLSEKLKASALKPRALTDKEEQERAEDGFETDEEADEGMAVDAEAKDMEVDGAEKPEGEQATVKVSTSGPRLSRRESYRTDKGFQIRLTRKTEFRARGEGKRMGCKPQRRR